MKQEEQIKQKLIAYNQSTYQRFVGVFGILLPIILIVGALLLNDCRAIQESISHYYYTAMGDAFVGIICAIAFFLIGYKYEKIDNITSDIAGFSSIGVALFPTGGSMETSCWIFNFNDLGFVPTVHYVCAAVFFLSLAYMSFFVFTKSGKVKTARKKMRNACYRTIGVIIALCVLIIFLLHQIDSLAEPTYKYRLVFVFESIALIAFGSAWLMKGELVLRDRVG